MITPLEEHEKSGEQLRVKLNEVILELEAITRFLEQKEQLDKSQGQTVQTTTRPPAMRTPNEPYELLEGEVLGKLSNGQLKVKGERGGYIMSVEQYKVTYPKQASEYLNSITENYEEADQTEGQTSEEAGE